AFGGHPLGVGEMREVTDPVTVELVHQPPTAAADQYTAVELSPSVPGQIRFRFLSVGRQRQGAIGAGAAEHCGLHPASVLHHSSSRRSQRAEPALYRSMDTGRTTPARASSPILEAELVELQDLGVLGDDANLVLGESVGPLRPDLDGELQLHA